MKQIRSIKLLILIILAGIFSFSIPKNAFGKEIELYGCITPQFSLFAAIGGEVNDSEIQISNTSGALLSAINSESIDSFTNDVFSFVVKTPLTVSTFQESDSYQIAYRGVSGSKTITFQKNGEALQGISSITPSGERLCDIALPPAVKIATTSENSISLDIVDRSTNETTFDLQRATECNTFLSIHAFSSNTNSQYSDIGTEVTPLQQDVLYCYRISAVNSTGKSFSNIVSAKTKSKKFLILPPVTLNSSPIAPVIPLPTLPQSHVAAPSSSKSWGDCLDRSVDPNGIFTLSCIPYFFTNIITGSLLLVGAVAVFIIIWSGIKFLLSEGDPKKVQEAKTVLTYAIIGLVVILFSFFVLNMISYFIGLDCIKMIGFSNCA